jgi:hypothetical protein
LLSRFVIRVRDAGTCPRKAHREGPPASANRRERVRRPTDISGNPRSTFRGTERCRRRDRPRACRILRPCAHSPQSQRPQIPPVAVPPSDALETLTGGTVLHLVSRTISPELRSSQSDEFWVAKVIIERPLKELNRLYQSRLQPPAFLCPQRSVLRLRWCATILHDHSTVRRFEARRD